ncbi:MAG: response regulator [Planctomycetes bacterium]|nr:response regulator [Planctomycetota bacterium]
MRDSKRMVILLVEDDRDDEDLTIRSLQRANVLNEVVVARDGVEALDWLESTGRFAGRDRDVEPQVVLLDLKLPRVDGIEVLRRIRADPRTKRLPVVVLTSSREEKDVVESYRLGANSFVQKPVNFTAFEEAVRQLGLYWLLLNVRPPMAREEG